MSCFLHSSSCMPITFSWFFRDSLIRTSLFLEKTRSRCLSDSPSILFNIESSALDVSMFTLISSHFRCNFCDVCLANPYHVGQRCPKSNEKKQRKRSNRRHRKNQQQNAVVANNESVSESESESESESDTSSEASELWNFDVTSRSPKFDDYFWFMF